jgi:DNA-binding transcriptional LysR family regulator
VGPIVEQLMLPQVLSRFLETTGEVSVSIVAEDDQTLLKLFADAELDIIVGPFSASEQSTDHVRGFEMVSDRIVAVVRASHPLCGEVITESALTQYPLVSPKAQGTVRGQNIPLTFNNLKIISDNYDSLRSLTLSSDAICMGPRAVFAAQVQSGDLVELPLPLSIEWKSALLVKRETYTTPLARHMVGLFEIVAKEVNKSLV